MPPLCDAFDRNFEVTLLRPGETREQGVELVRAITPFGGPMAFEADITDVANARPGENDVHVHITTFSDGQGLVSGSNGGWNVTVDVDVEEGPAPRNVLAVVSAFNGIITEGGVEQLYPFTLPAGTVRTTLAVRTTGHGGPNTDSDCIGPAEEFCRRFHFTRVDDIDLAFSEPFIESCEQMCTLAREGPVNGGFDYCQENPTGAIQSVRAPRANWCPGAVTEPRVYDDALDRLGAGEHTLGYEVERIAPGGLWRTSATFTAYGE
jgi:Peptide-N-glycosidase F, C terminal